MKTTIKSEQRLFLFAAACLGAYALVSQVLFIRQFMTVFMGNELCISTVLGSWLAGVALGSFFSSFLNRFKNKISVNVFLVTAGILVFVCPAQIYLVQALCLIFHVPVGQSASLVQIVFAAFLTTLPVSLLIGFSFALACSAYPHLSCNTRTISAVYIAEAAGSLAAGILFTFFLIPYFPAFFVLAVMGILLMSGLILVKLRGYSGRKKIFGTFVIAALMIVIWLSGAIDFVERKAIDTRLRGLGFSSKCSAMNNWRIVSSRDSRYQHLTLLERAGQYVLLENGQVSFVFPDEVTYEYLAHFIMVQHPRPQKVLVIGSGAAGLLKYILKHPVETLDYVELDPAVIDIIQPVLPEADKKTLADDRVVVHYLDGRRFVKLSGKKYDFVLLNTPSPSTAALNRFYTLEFFREIKKILSSGGVLFLSIPSAIHLSEDTASFAGSINLTLGKVFPRVLVTAGETNMFFAGDNQSQMTFDAGVLRQRFEQRHITARYFNAYCYQANDNLRPDKVKFTQERLETQGRLNTDTRPITYYLNLILWSYYSGSHVAHVFRAVQSLPPGLFAGFIFAGMLIYITWIIMPVRGKDRQEGIDKKMRTSILIIIAATGLAGMVLEMVIIFSFQSICGYVYEKIGLIVASFMLGLVAGASFIKARLKGSNIRLYGWLISAEAMLLVIAIATIYFINNLTIVAWGPVPYSGMEAVFYLMILLIGAGVGAEFPLASSIFINSGGRPITSAALTDMTDHIGAFIGAFFTGIIFVPVLGISGSCWLVAMVKIFTLLLLLSLFFAGKGLKKTNTLSGKHSDRD